MLADLSVPITRKIARGHASCFAFTRLPASEVSTWCRAGGARASSCQEDDAHRVVPFSVVVIRRMGGQSRFDLDLIFDPVGLETDL